MARVNRRKLRLTDVEITIDTEEEDMQIRGHFDDPETEREIIESYQSGNGFAWCYVIVTAKWVDPSGFEHTGRDTLGGVSCLPTEDMTARQAFEALVKDHGMAEQALADLQREVNEHDKRELERQITAHVQSLSDQTLNSWVNRSFQTVLPIATLELRRRAIK